MTDTNNKPKTNRNPIASLFLDHPESVDETFFEHMKFALSFSGALLFAGLAALIHAVLPFACETTASRIIKRLHNKIENRH